MGGNESIITNSNIGYSSGSTLITSDSEQVKISNGVILIKTTNSKNVYVNGEKCLPCDVLKKIIDNKDEKLFEIYNRYCT